MAGKNKDKVLDIIPTLVIGCGGNGQNILKKLRASFVESFDNLGADFNAMPIELLAIDTIGQERRENQLPDEDYFKLGPIQMDKEMFHIKTEGQEPYLKSWMDTNLYAGLLSMGAMQIRAVGRLALFIKLPELINILEKKIKSILNLNNTKGNKTDKCFFNFDSDKEIQIHIVGGIAGGTGAGIMIDLAYLLQSMVERSAVTFGHFVMPETIIDAQIQDSLYANAYSFLMELDNFNVRPSLYYDYSPITKYILSKKDGGDFDSSFADETNEEREISPPFTFCFIMSPHGRNNLLRDKERLHDVIAGKILLGTIDEVGDRSMERTVNIYSNFLGGFYEIDGGSKRCAYSSYGVSVLKVKKDSFYRFIKNELVKSVSQTDATNIKEMKKEGLGIDGSPEIIFVNEITVIKNKVFHLDQSDEINALYLGNKTKPKYSDMQDAWQKVIFDDDRKFESENIKTRILNTLIDLKSLPIKAVVEKALPVPINPIPGPGNESPKVLENLGQNQTIIIAYTQYIREKNVSY